MKKSIVLYFALFGLVFGSINTLDPTGGEIPYTMLLNFPTLVVSGQVNNTFNTVERSRVDELGGETGISTQNQTLSRDKFEKLLPMEQEAFVSKMSQQKNLVRNDSIIGEKGILYTIRNFISFPILSALTWGLIGIVVYIIVFIKKKFTQLK